MTLQFFNKTFNLGGKSTIPLDFGGFKLGVSEAVKKVLEFFGYPLTLTNIPTATTLTGYKVYGNTEQGLPDGYTQLEYIVTGGNAYIDTGYKPSPSLTRFEGAFLVQSGGTRGLLGARIQVSASNIESVNVFTMSTSKLRLDWVSANGDMPIQVKANDKHTISITRNKATIDGQQYTATAEIVNRYINFNFYIGTINSAGTPYTGFVGNIYDCKLYDNDNLIRDYIPCKRNSDNAVGLYDMVENKFYASASTTAFTAGTEVTSITPSTPVPIQSVGELQTDGRYKIPITVNGTTTNIYLSEPLRKIGDYADYIDFENQEVVRNIVRHTVKSLHEGGYWIIASTNRFNSKLKDSVTGSASNNPIMSTGYKSEFRVNKRNCFLSGSAGIGVCCVDTTYETIEDFVANRGDIEFYYALATPTTEKITLPDIAIPKGDSVITTDTEIKPSDMYGKVIV